MDHTFVSGRACRAALLAATALTGAMFAGQASAQTSPTDRVIDNGASVTVIGGRPLSHPYKLIVGQQSFGGLFARSGGQVTTGSAVLGEQSGSVGLATLSGPGTHWRNNGSLTVGESGHGILQIVDGASLRSQGLTLGSKVGGLGELSVGGLDARLNVDYGIDVGLFGDGVMTVDSGGYVTSDHALIGLGEGASGHVTVSGQGSGWTASTFLIGEAGRGVLEISDGGNVTLNTLRAGYHTSGSGSIRVAGAGSQLNVAGATDIGRSGSGEVVVTDGGRASFGQTTVGGAQSGSGRMIATGTGSTLTFSNDLIVGDNGGYGEILVADGAQVAGMKLFVGNNGGGGAVVVSGPETALSLGELNLGWSPMGSGKLEVSNGGLVQARSVALGMDVGTMGGVLITGEGAILRAADLYVGFFGSGAIHIQNGGRLEGGLASLGTYEGAGRIQIGGAAGQAAQAGGTLSLSSGLYLGTNGVLGVNHTGVSLADALTIDFGLYGDGLIEHEAGLTRITATNDQFVGRVDLKGGELVLEATRALGDAVIHMGEGSVLNLSSVSADNALVVEGVASIRTDYGWSGQYGSISGSADLIKMGEGSLNLIGDARAFTGELVVAEGEVLLNGSNMGGAVKVRSAGRLIGNGRMKGLIVEGEVNPGHVYPSPYATLIVDGDYVQRVGSTYRFNIDASGRSDLIAVSGTATLQGGTAYADKASGVYIPGTRWTVLTAAGGVIGRFASFEQNAPFVDLSLIYTPNSVQVEAVRNSTPFAEAASSSNQRLVARSIEAQGAGSAVHDAVVGSGSREAAREAFDQLSGGAYGAVSNLAFEGVLSGQDAVLRNLRDGRDLNWSQDLDQERSLTGSTAAGGDTRTTGWAAGRNVAFGELTLAVSAMEVRDDFNSRAQRGESQVVSRTGGLAVRWAPGAFSLAAGVGHGEVQVDMDRRIHLPALMGAASGDQSGRVSHAFAETSWRKAWTGGGVEPFVGVSAVDLRTDAAQERGSAARLNLHAAAFNAATSTVGLRLNAGAGDWTLEGSAAWRRAYGDLATRTAATFEGGDLPFMVGGDVLSRDAALVDIQGSWSPEGRPVQLSFGYAGRIGDRSDSHGLQARASLTF